MKIKTLIIIILLICFDQFIKFISILKLKPISSYEVIKDFFYLTYVENRGAAFGIFSGARIILIILTLIILGVCFKFYKNIKQNKLQYFYKTSLILIISGAIGNLIDRIFRGYVVDMLHFIIFGKDFAVFNFADVYVVLGTFLIAITILIGDFILKSEEN